MRTFLVCEDPEHAHLVDQMVFARLEAAEMAKGNRWSGVYTNGTSYGILWASPVSDLFGIPADFPELVLVEETDAHPWSEYEPTADTPQE